ncbi:ABC transporter permease, partial [Candidatus Woesearchaeota archaeon]|nr:ABC transporter permease [Candidatus Woesearchaeota archaeon]
MFTDYIRFSIGNFRRRKIRSFLTMIGIFIGIAAVVSLIGLGEGLRTAILSQFEFVGTDMLSVQAASFALAGAPGTAAPDPLTDDLPDKIAKVDGVELAFGRYIKGVTMEFNDRQVIGSVVSMPDGDERKFITSRFNMKVAQGRLLKDGDSRKVLLGGNFAEDDNRFGKAVSAGDSILFNEIKYDVIGILEKKGSFIVDESVLINTEPMLDDFGDDGTVNIIAVKLEDPNEADKVIEDIEKLLRKERGVKEGEEDFSVESAQQTIEALNSTLFAVQLFVYIIAAISLLVGGIGIMNTMYTAVLERTKEIGVMKSIGAKNSTIFTLFSIESGLLGMTGGLVGLALGLLLAYGLAAAGRVALGVDLIQAHVSLQLIIGSLLFSFIVGTIAGVLPAYQASQMQPV